MKPIESEFILACRQDIKDVAVRSAYHDWLVDEGRTLDAEAFRKEWQKNEPPTKFSELVGHVLISVEKSESKYEDALLFTLADGSVYKMYHSTD